jgi:exonuclease III
MDPTNILVWDVRVLNSTAQQDSVRTQIDSSKIVVCLQETKMTNISRLLVIRMLGPDFGNFVFLPSAGTSGGVLIAWRDHLIFQGILRVDQHVSLFSSALMLVSFGGFLVSTHRRVIKLRLISSMSSGSSDHIAVAHG